MQMKRPAVGRGRINSFRISRYNNNELKKSTSCHYRSFSSPNPSYDIPTSLLKIKKKSRLCDHFNTERTRSIGFKIRLRRDG